MRKILGSTLALFFLAWGVQAAPETFKIDGVHSSVGFKIRHLGISWVTGSFKKFEGAVVFDPQKPEASSVQVTVEAASVDTGNEKRDEHLRAPDYFHVEKFPTLTFKSTKVEKIGDNLYKVTGDFTLLGVTKPLTFEFQGTDEVDGRGGEKRRGGETAFTIKRSEFGLKESIGPIGDEVQISLAFSGVKQ